MKRDLILVFVLCGALADPVLASSTAAETSTLAAARSVEVVQLRVGLGGSDIELLVPLGASAEITDHRQNRKLRFEPSIQPGFQNQSGKKQVALVILESPAGRDQASGQENILDVVLLSEEGPTVTVSHGSLELGLRKVVELEVASGTGTGGPQDMEMVDCCITCHGVTTCALCVWTACGRCCGG